ncbi:MAG: outer membrane lipoprotein-sorting protein [Puniceicoccales bacterium]|jgi:hypothetical protein|nr:outer membrane lipoprotein-sorting protein [Puniceicoccales bacterium]
MKVSKFLLPLVVLEVSLSAWAIPNVRHRKSLEPLTAQQVAEVVQKLKTFQGLNCAFIFDLKTTIGKTTETEEGKFYSQQNTNGVKLRFNFGNRSFLSLGKSDGEIFCSEQSVKMTLDTPIWPGHLLNFADILMPFLDWNSYEYRHPKRIQGRNTHIVRFKESTGRFVDIAYDPTFEAILRFEYLDEKEKLLRTFKLLNFKKIQNMWLMKSIEIKDVPSNTTTQLIVKKVAVDQTISVNLFDKNTLGKPPEDCLNYTNF